MFGALGLFGSREAALDNPDMFGAQGFFGTELASDPEETFYILDAEGNRITGIEGDRLLQEESP